MSGDTTQPKSATQHLAYFLSSPWTIVPYRGEVENRFLNVSAQHALCRYSVRAGASLSAGTGSCTRHTDFPAGHGSPSRTAVWRRLAPVLVVCTALSSVCTRRPVGCRSQRACARACLTVAVGRVSQQSGCLIGDVQAETESNQESV